ncbi:MAG: hypothetical protein RLZZ450_2315 [Pseudomonadota bacterium]
MNRQLARLGAAVTVLPLFCMLDSPLVRAQPTPLQPAAETVACSDALGAIVRSAASTGFAVRGVRAAPVAGRLPERAITVKRGFGLSTPLSSPYALNAANSPVATAGNALSGTFSLVSLDQTPVVQKAASWTWSPAGLQIVAPGPPGNSETIVALECARVSSRTLVRYAVRGLASPSSASWMFTFEPNAEVADEVLGFADLHTHPAGHLAFDGPADGSGMFWGYPGRALATSSPQSDLRACVPDTHSLGSNGSGYDDDQIRHTARQKIMANFEPGANGWVHEGDGSPSFRSWPHAESLSHQKMHISWLRRAFDGGLRLLVASAHDNQLLAEAHRMRIGHEDPPQVDRNFDFDSSIRQLNEIKCLVQANSDFLGIATDASTAEQLIRAGKMAVILGVEMDQLSAEQLLELVKSHQVRTVIPIHLADNAFGGTAVYRDLFNSSSNFLNGRPFAVLGDPNISFRLGAWGVVVAEALGVGWSPATVASRSVFEAGYSCFADRAPAHGCISAHKGHRNAAGLTDVGRALLSELMKLGVLIDVSHMSMKSTDDALALAETSGSNQAKGYPLLSSHTGIRRAELCSESERSLTTQQAQRLRALGGVLGFGTAGGSASAALASVGDVPLVAGFELDLARPGKYGLIRITIEGHISYMERLPANGLDTAVSRAAATLRIKLRDGRTLERSLQFTPSSVRLPTDHSPLRLLNAAVPPHEEFRVEGMSSYDQVASVAIETPSGQRLHTKSIEVAEYVSAVRRYRTILRRRAVDELQTGGSFVSNFAVDVREAPVISPCQNDTAWPGTQKVAMVRVEVDSDFNSESRASQLGSILLRSEGRDIEVPFSTRPTQIIRLQTPVDYDAFKTLRLAARARGYLRSLRVDVMNDPIVHWTNGVTSALQTIGGRGIALGTDLNAPERQIPYTSISTGRSDLAKRLGIAGAQPLPAMQRSNSNTYSIQRDGIANVGMLPDFLQAVDAAPGGSAVAEELFHSAEDVIRMWRRVDAYVRANGNAVPAQLPSPICN